jgi:hypothetical protein
VYAHNCVLIRIYNYYCYYIYTHSQRETWEETFDFGNGRYGVRVNLPFHQSIDRFFSTNRLSQGVFLIAWSMFASGLQCGGPIVRIWFPIGGYFLKWRYPKSSVVL